MIHQFLCGQLHALCALEISQKPNTSNRLPFIKNNRGKLQLVTYRKTANLVYVDEKKLYLKIKICTQVRKNIYNK